jgi:hypothetical protein
MEDYLEVEPLIKTRLKEKIPNAQILSSWGQPVIKESHDLPPSVMVFLENDRPQDSVATGRNQKIEQTWLALVVVKDAENEAGPLISKVIRALSGWLPQDSRFSPFKRTKSSYVPDYSPNGIFYFPLSFSTVFVFNSE